MDLRQLEIVQAIAETGSFTGAGRKLRVSQSAISRQILLLEEELNESIFLRVGRRIRITPAGDALLKLGHRVFGDIKETITVIGESQQTLGGTLRLAGGMTVCMYVFPALLQEYRRQHSGVEVKLITGTSQRLRVQTYSPSSVGQTDSTQRPPRKVRNARTSPMSRWVASTRVREPSSGA